MAASATAVASDRLSSLFGAVGLVAGAVYLLVPIGLAGGAPGLVLAGAVGSMAVLGWFAWAGMQVLRPPPA